VSSLSSSAATEAVLILGTIGYMAPEQARGEKVAAEADIFALGVRSTARSLKPPED
jgi:serine/threonine protein kinase